MTTLTKQEEKFVAAFREVVQEHGRETRYLRPGDTTACLYVHNRGEENETPGCVFGHVYHKMFGRGMPSEWETMNIAVIIENARVLKGISPVVAEAALAAQHLQDRGENWGTALTCFENLLELTTTWEPATVEV